MNVRIQGLSVLLPRICTIGGLVLLQWLRSSIVEEVDGDARVTTAVGGQERPIKIGEQIYFCAHVCTLSENARDSVHVGLSVVSCSNS